MCIAQKVKYRFNLTEIEEIYNACIKIKDKFVKRHIVKKNPKSQYDSFIFVDNSRLTFKLCEGTRDLIVWNYYTTNRSYYNV